MTGTSHAGGHKPVSQTATVRVGPGPGRRLGSQAQLDSVSAASEPQPEFPERPEPRSTAGCRPPAVGRPRLPLVRPPGRGLARRRQPDSDSDDGGMWPTRRKLGNDECASRCASVMVGRAAPGPGPGGPRPGPDNFNCCHRLTEAMTPLSESGWCRPGALGTAPSACSVVNPSHGTRRGRRVKLAGQTIMIVTVAVPRLSRSMPRSNSASDRRDSARPGGRIRLPGR